MKTNRVGEYVYDAWGNHTVQNEYGGVEYSTSFIGNINPFRKTNNSLMKITRSGNYSIRASFAGYKVGGFYNASGLIFSFF